jgi:hypothetical protein
MRIRLRGISSFLTRETCPVLLLKWKYIACTDVILDKNLSDSQRTILRKLFAILATKLQI